MSIYLITTVHNRETRWNYIRGRMEALDVHYNAVLAPDYRLFLNGLTEQQAKHQSLTLAYLQITQEHLYSGFGQYMVIEDDICFTENGREDLIEAMQNLPPDWDFFYGTKTEHNRQAANTIPVNDWVCKVVDNWWQTPITVWNRRIIETFNERMMAKMGVEHLGNIDHELMKICEEGNLNFYGAEKNTANGLSSENGEEFESFKKGSLTELKQENVSL